jgi:hypothetical protein
MFLRLTTQNRDGDIEPRLVAADDISVVKPASNGTAPARSCVITKAQPDFPVWAIEDMNAIETALAHLGCSMAPHQGRPRRG